MGKLSGIVLTGGKSSRFKKDKAFATNKGLSFYEHAVQVMVACTDTIIVVGRDNQPVKLDSPNIGVIKDLERFKGQGPLAGIYSAMAAGNTEWYLVLPVDMPFIDQYILKKLTTKIHENTDAIVARINGRLQPLVALYKKKTSQMMEQQLTSGQRSMRQLLDHLHVTYVDFPEQEEKYFININTQEEYQQHVIAKLE